MTYLFFTDIDGTLLDHDTYSYEMSRAGMDSLRERCIPLVMVSSKTLPEMRKLHDELRLDAPFIFENGGGICWQGNTIEWIGMNSRDLYRMKGALEKAAGMSVRFITDMEAGEIATLTGLSVERAEMAQQRQASLPFVISAGSTIDAAGIDRVNRILAERGVAITKGGRFYHLLSKGSDKGKAILKIVDHYRKRQEGPLITVGIGDSENDIPMLMAVDRPFIVKKKNGTGIQTGLQTVRETTGIGPAGFTEAVTAVLGAEK
jgi:mannosyl-3-phosphoglycerate phosphatase